MFATVERFEDGIISLELDIGIMIQIPEKEFPYQFEIGDIFKILAIEIKNNTYKILRLRKDIDEKQKRLDEVSKLRESIKNKKH